MKILLALLLAMVLPAIAVADSMSLHDAVRSENTVALRALTAKTGALDARDSNGWTALMLATDAGSLDAISVLLAAGQGGAIYQPE